MILLRTNSHSLRVTQTGASSRQTPAQAEAVTGVCIGNFDGMHFGHQELFNTLRIKLDQVAEASGKIPNRVLLTFAPHPREVLARISARAQPILKKPAGEKINQKSLCCLRQKICLAEHYGFNSVFLAKFSSALAALTPEQFVERYLVNTLQCSLVVVGYDWSFGKGKAGNVETLKELGTHYGFAVEVVGRVDCNDSRVSTSLLKQAAVAGDFARFEALTGRGFSICAMISAGEKRGRELGFPTANLLLNRQLTPPSGVYAVRVIHEGTTYLGAANLGTKPTFAGTQQVLEVHILDADLGQIYGNWLSVEFIKKVRDEQKFSGAEQLKTQIAKDILEVRQILAATPYES